ncbi:hypothetical protein YC2023_118813 [Brassica napus]
MSPSDLIMMVLRFLSFMVGNIGILAPGPVCFSVWFMIVLWYVSNIIWNMIGTIGGRGSLADHLKSNRKRCSLTKEWGREAEIMGWQMWKQGCRCLVCRHTLGIVLKIYGWVPSWTAQWMVFWSRCLELLTGKRVLWLDSLNQPQKTKLTIAMDLKRSHRLARTDARRIIWHVDEFYILSITSLLLFLFHKGINSSNRGTFEGICGMGGKESLRFLNLDWIVNDRVGNFGLTMLQHSVNPCLGTEIDISFKVFVGIWDSLEWRLEVFD